MKKYISLLNSNGDELIRVEDSTSENGRKILYLIFKDSYTGQEVRISTMKYKEYAKARKSLFDLAAKNKDKIITPYLGNHKNFVIKYGKCSHTEKKEPSNYKKGNGCTICNNQTIIAGFNDINTTHPHLAKYFANEDDKYKYSCGSSKYVDMKCHNCGKHKKERINRLNENGFSCKYCSDGIKYPEKFITEFLSQLESFEQINKFDIQPNKLIFDWCGEYRYDYYIKDIDCIIEAHGSQHYEYGFRSAEYEQDNDKVKKELAISNRISKYIEIDCRKSTKDWIKESILRSELSSIYDLSNVDWDKCDEYATSSLVKIVCDIWNKYNLIKVNQVREHIKLSQQTIRRYLKRGANLGLCDYISQKDKDGKCIR